MEGAPAAPSWHRREEARRIREIEEDRLEEVTRQATLEALYRYPSPAPKHFFGWLRETIAHHTLTFLKGELTDIQTVWHRADEAEAMQAVLAGLEGADPPPMAERSHFDRWQRRIRPLYDAVGAYTEIAEVRQACHTAVARLAPRQRQVINEHFYGGREAADIAAGMRVSWLTIYNTKAQALSNLHDDDCFFMALCGLRLVRDSVRKEQLAERYPDGRLPDGRRLIHIHEAA